MRLATTSTSLHSRVVRVLFGSTHVEIRHSDLAESGALSALPEDVQWAQHQQNGLFDITVCSTDLLKL